MRIPTSARRYEPDNLYFGMLECSAPANNIFAADLPKFYIDEATGDDNANDGSENLPYKSVLGAYIARGTTDVELFIRKKEDVTSEPSTHTPAGTTASISQSPWHPVTTSAVKKGKKLFEQHQKKIARAAELAEKEKDKEGAENKKLEDSKKIVLEEPSTSAKKIKIKQGKQTRDVRVRIFGWVHRLRQQSGLTFIVLRDGTGYLQCVMSGKLVCFHNTRLSFHFKT
jgi:asparaginyl-tRNA synthetase